MAEDLAFEEQPLFCKCLSLASVDRRGEDAQWKLSSRRRQFPPRRPSPFRTLAINLQVMANSPKISTLSLIPIGDI